MAIEVDRCADDRRDGACSCTWTSRPFRRSRPTTASRTCATSYALPFSPGVSCVRSRWGIPGETIGAARSWEDIIKLTDELSMGISFRGDSELAGYEVHAAAAAFCGHPPDERWEEAFHTDPHTPRDVLFAGGLRVTSYFPPDEFRLAEVAYSKDLEANLESVYETVRREGWTFEQQVEREFAEMVYWKLGPLTDPERFAAQLKARSRGLHGEWTQDIVDIDPAPLTTRT